MNVETVLLPCDLTPAHRDGRSVVVFDVLRATTSIVAALEAGVREVRVYGGVDEAREAASVCGDGARLLCGEANCLPPAGFDLGNSPGAFDRGAHAGRVMFLSTTNGTRAIVAARGAPAIYVSALTNADAVARALSEVRRDVTLLCAGTGGAVALEDVLGAGAVIDGLQRVRGPLAIAVRDDTSLLALRLFHATKNDLAAALRETRGGRNVIAAGLEPDIDFAARLNSTEVVGIIEASDNLATSSTPQDQPPPTVRPLA